ncbi:Uncharacterised protein [Mycobacterium tuberculosis]|nr:Uncharacterised protein [Mycobacterium tuberculosis]
MVVASVNTEYRPFPRVVHPSVHLARFKIVDDGLHIPDVARLLRKHMSFCHQRQYHILIDACLPGDIRIVAGEDARRQDRLLNRHVVLNDIQNRLRHGRNDRGTARRAYRHKRFVVLHHNRGRHAAARTFSWLYLIGTAWHGVKVSQLVIQHEAVPRNHDPRPKNILNRRRVGDQISPLVHHGEMGGVYVLACLA